MRYGISAGGCTVDPATGSVTSQSSSNSCRVTAYWTGDDNNAPSDNTVEIARISLVASSWDDPTWSVPSNAVNPTVGGAPTLPAVAGNTEAEPLDYRSKTLDYCSVSLGYVTGLAAGDGVCILEARTAGNDAAGPSAWVASPPITVDKGTQTIGGSNFYGENPTLPKDETLELVDPPEGFGAATYSVKSGSESYCEVDGASGIVTGIAPGDCILQVAFAGDDNYNALDATDLQTVVVTEWNQTIVAENPYGENPSLTAGQTLAIVNEPEATIVDLAGEEQAGGAITYTTSDSSICTIAADGTSVKGVAVGDCTVRINVAAVDAVAADATANPPVVGNAAYNGATKDLVTIAVGKGTMRITWNVYKNGQTYRAGGEGAIDEVDTSNVAGGLNTVYTVSNPGDTGCAFKPASFVLTFDDHGVCVVKVVATKEHYEDWTAERVLRVRPGSISVTVNDFVSSHKLKVGVQAAKKPAAYAGLTPSDAEASWRLVRGERDCVLTNPVDGSVVARAVSFADGTPECSIQLVARKQGHETYRSGAISIPLEKGDLPSLSPPVYGSGVGTSTSYP